MQGLLLLDQANPAVLRNADVKEATTRIFAATALRCAVSALQAVVCAQAGAGHQQNAPSTGQRLASWIGQGPRDYGQVVNCHMAFTLCIVVVLRFV